MVALLYSFSLQVSLFGYECVFSFYSEKVGKPNTKQWLAYAISFNLEGGLSYCLAVYNYLFIPLSSGGASCTEMQKSFFDWWDSLWTLQSVFSEYNSQKQLWKYFKVLSSFFLTSWLILNKLFLSFFFIDKCEGERGKSYKCVSLYVNMVSSVTCAFHFSF